MKIVLIAATLLTTFACGHAAAQEAAATPAADAVNELTFNAAITSDYRYRGISQTR